MRPVARDPPLCTLRELKDGTYTINDLADFHELMDEEEEYAARYRDAQERERERDQ